MFSSPVIYDGKPIHSLAEYESARQHRREFDDQKPYAAVFLLADSSLLFWKEEGIDWINRVKCELPSRALTFDGYEAEVKASYIGAANDDMPEFFDTFRAAMAQIGVEDCMHIHASPSADERSHLEQSDIVLLAGGSVDKGWKALASVDGSPTYLGESIRWRYYDGAVLIGVAEGAAMLGQKSFTMLPEQQRTERERRSFFKTLGIVPSIVVTGDVSDDVTHSIATQLGPGTIQIGIPRGAGCIFNTDTSFEPVRAILSDVHYDYQRSGPHTNLVAPPEKGEGIIVAVERLRAREKRARELRAAEEEVRRAAGLTPDRPEDDDDGDEERGVTDGFRSKAAQLKELGNEAFKKGDVDTALSLYREAQLSDREDPKICLNIAACLLRQGTQQAVTDCVSVCGVALRLSNGKLAKGWFRRAMALRRLGQHQQSLLDLQEALVLEPENKDVKKELGAGEEAAAEETFDAGVLEAAVVAARSSHERVLDLTDRKIGPRATRDLCRMVAEDDQIIHYRLRGNWMRGPGGEALGKCLHGNATASELDLSHNALRDRGLRLLIQDGMLQSSALAVLKLAHNGIQDSAVESLAEVLRDCPSMREVDLSANELTFASAAHIAPLLRSHAALEKVDLSAQHGAGMGDDAVWRLVGAVAQHPAMRELDVRGRTLSRDTYVRLDQRMRHAQCLVRVGRLKPEAAPAPF